MNWIEAGDIKNWVTSKRRDCEQTLPELIQRLILATATSVSRVDFPSGDNVAIGGWDGYLETTSESPYFPKGISGWEMGVEPSPGKKADRDYAARTARPGGLVKSRSSFVFVTPRPWPKRREWESEKRRARRWKHVRAIAGDELEQWLVSAPAVSLWLARKIGKLISNDIRDLEGVWDEWSLSTKPAMSPGIVISGRGKDVDKVRQWISNAADLLEVQGDSPDEALAFLYSAISVLPETDRTKALSRCIVVEDIDQFRACAKVYQNPLIIAAPTECLDAAGAATALGHHVFLSMNAKTLDRGGQALTLSRPRRGIFEEALLANGFSKAKARRYARDSGCSLPVLRRELSRSSSVKIPQWAQGESAQFLVAVLLAGAWIDSNAGDREVLETLSTKSYESLSKELEALRSIDDSPVRCVGNVWTLKSPLDGWFLLARHIDSEHLKRFRQAINAVLTETNPKYELSPDQRWAAAIYGKAPRYSEWLREGLVESLVLLAVYGDRASAVNVSPQGFADSVVNGVLTGAQTWQAWSSLKDVTPLLAEAAPEALIFVIERRLAEDPTLFTELMRDDGTIFGECRHCGMLWALESLAWHPDYFASATRILAVLAKIDDPNAKWGNRPLKSLRDCFVPGLPQTHATPSQRLAAFDKLAEQEPRIAWNVVQGFFGQTSISESHRFRWRDSGGERLGLEEESNEAYRTYLTGLISRLGTLACATPDNLIGAIDHFTLVPADIQTAVLNALETIDHAKLAKEELEHLRESLRKTLHWINSYGNEEMRKYAVALGEALERLAPSNVIERVGWLLSNPWPSLPEGESENYTLYESQVAKRREQAARELLNEASLSQILDYARTVDYIRLFGHAIGKAVRDESEDAMVLNAMLNRISTNPEVVTGYALGRVDATGPDWVIHQVERLKAQGNSSPEGCALLYLGLPENAQTWALVASHGAEVEQAYWKRARGHSSGNFAEDAPIAVEKLLDADRAEAALEVAGNPRVSIRSTLLKRLLDAFLSLDVKTHQINVTMLGFRVAHIFKQLYERNELSLEEIARLEWPFSHVFDDIRRHTKVPLAIHRLLQKDPTLFNQLVSFIYKHDDGTVDEQPEMSESQRIRLADNAREVLRTWQLVPGFDDQGLVNEEALREWIHSVRQQASKDRRAKGCDYQIAEMLARAPADSDGTWPHVAVRNLLESLKNQIIEEHIPIAVYNNRGVTTRGPFDGGQQERDLAKNYETMARAVSTKWPRTAAMLRSMSKKYKSQAKDEDISSDLLDLR